MAEALQSNTQSLAESWSLPPEVTESVIPVNESYYGNQKEATSEAAVPESAESPPAAEKPDDMMAEKVDESVEKINDIPADKMTELPSEEKADSKEEDGETPEEEQPEEETVEEEQTIKIETAPADFRFPTTNQTRHCFTRYIEYHRCIQAKGEGTPECDNFARYYRSLCPSEWIERWNEQRESGTFPGPL